MAILGKTKLGHNDMEERNRLYKIITGQLYRVGTVAREDSQTNRRYSPYALFRLSGVSIPGLSV